MKRFIILSRFFNAVKRNVSIHVFQTYQQHSINILETGYQAWALQDPSFSSSQIFRMGFSAGALVVAIAVIGLVWVTNGVFRH
ncbi:MAG: hypothetical protein ACI32N_04560 [Bulleidia sp.]